MLLNIHVSIFMSARERQWNFTIAVIFSINMHVCVDGLLLLTSFNSILL